MGQAVLIAAWWDVPLSALGQCCALLSWWRSWGGTQLCIPLRLQRPSVHGVQNNTAQEMSSLEANAALALCCWLRRGQRRCFELMTPLFKVQAFFWEEAQPRESKQQRKRMRKLPLPSSWPGPSAALGRWVLGVLSCRQEEAEARGMFLLQSACPGALWWLPGSPLRGVEEIPPMGTAAGSELLCTLCFFPFLHPKCVGWFLPLLFLETPLSPCSPCCCSCLKVVNLLPEVGPDGPLSTKLPPCYFFCTP